MSGSLSRIVGHFVCSCSSLSLIVVLYSAIRLSNSPIEGVAMWVWLWVEGVALTQSECKKLVR